jgi:tRNA pseudouridine38-40 synthase
MGVMPTFKLTLAYDGTGYVGWQRQASGTSIQGLLEDALGELDGGDVSVTGAGRTDAGVHALGQVARVSTERLIGAAALVGAINARLPGTVRVLAAEEVPPTFRARVNARSKTYRYRIWNGEVISPFERAYAWHVRTPLDVEAMASGACVLEGRHDFAAFQAADTDARTTERVVFSSRVHSSLVDGGPEGPPYVGSPDIGSAGLQAWGGTLIIYEISGSGFLRHMVRNIVGTLVELGRRRRAAPWVSRVLASRDRAQGGPTAPPEGLFLVRVEYDAPPAAER